ncbi:MAG TPA: nucleoside deaminase [Ginsengibacter sp.]|nr:nucleoside deaminase [Ginsengibacter sp.]HRP43436.1 nucleoside deaminase [Ginsengibacter sp.]
MTREEKFMMEAVKLAGKGVMASEGGPFGCVIVKGDEIVGRGNNRVLTDNDPTSHAEVVAIRDACARLGTYQLDDCEIYASCEPCPMCLGAIYWARPKVVYYAGTKDDAAKSGFDDSFIYREIELPHEQRKIPFLKIQVSDALEPFRVWDEKSDKKEY